MKTASPQGSVFVRLSPRYRELILGGVAIYIAVVGLACWRYAVPATMLIYMTLIFNLGLILLPIVRPSREFGWAHPVVVRSLFAILYHVSRTPLYIFGLQSNNALLHLDHAELTRLLAFEMLLNSLGTIAYYAGYYSRICPRVPQLTFKPIPGIQTRALLMVGFAGIVFAVLMASHGGVELHLLSWGDVGRRATSWGQGHWVKLIHLGALACILWLAADRAVLRQPLFYAALGSSLAWDFLKSGSRSALIQTVLACCIIWLMRARKMVPVRTVAVAVCLLVALSSLGRLRSSVHEGHVDWEALYTVGMVRSIQSAGSGLGHRQGAGSATYPVLAMVPQQVDLLWGRSYLDILTLPIPRTLWPDKPGSVGRTAGGLFFGVRAGTPPGAVAESYWNFHVPGVFLHFFLFGIFHRWLAKLLIEYSEAAAVQAFFAVTVLWAAPSFGAITGFIFATLLQIPLYVLCGGLRFGARRAVAHAPA